MVFRGVSRFALGAALRAVAVGALAVVAYGLIFHQRYYATGAVVIGAGMLITADLARMVRSADRVFADFVESLAAGAADAPTRAAARFPALAESLSQAAARLDRDRFNRERRIQEVEALLDTVAAALLIVEEDGRVTLANRAARELCGQSGPKLADIRALGEARERIMAMLPGARGIVQLADGRRMLASAAGFRGGVGPQRRLVSLQSLSGELSAVEIQAWQDLVRVLAHEMMNSLTPILSLTESLQAPGGPPSPAETAGAIEVIARRSSGLMSFVERYRRVADLPEPRPRDLAAADLVAGLDRLMAGLLSERAVAYQSRVDPPDVRLSADPELLEQALINLLKNALEAAAETADPRIELACVKVDGRLCFRVSDNGRGLPESDPERVFTPFFTTKAGGSGVGLSLARQVALAHGGALTAAANLPRGAVFTLALPLG